MGPSRPEYTTVSGIHILKRFKLTFRLFRSASADVDLLRILFFLPAGRSSFPVSGLTFGRGARNWNSRSPGSKPRS